MGVALLLVDVQREFMAKAGLTPPARSILAAVERWRERAGRDGWPVFHVGVETGDDPSAWPPQWRTVPRPPCIAGSEGAQFVAEPRAGERSFTKQRYGAFDDPALEPALREAGVDTVVLAGVNTHACILATALEAEARGFAVRLAADAFGSYDAAHGVASRAWLASRIAPELGLDEMASADDAVTAIAARLASDAAHIASMPLEDRRGLLSAWRDALTERREEIVALLVGEVAKPLRDARGEWSYALALLERTIATLSDREAGEPEVRHHPLGLVAAITPWNNPLALPIGKLAPALGYGNAVLWKPAPQAARMARVLLETLENAGLGRFVALVEGGAAEGRAVVTAPGVAAVAFTGSTRVGRAIAARCGPLGRRVQAELGGNNAAIVAADADVAAAARDLVPAMFSFAGQRCTAIRRLVVEAAVAGPFEAALRREMAELVVGDPAEEATHCGPVIDTKAAERLRAARVAAVEGGARIVAEAAAPDGGNFVAPVILGDLSGDHVLVQDEQFGPLAVLQVVPDFDAALTKHNAVEQGLLGVLYSDDPERRARFAAEAQAGMLSYGSARPAFAASGPFSGWGSSALGPPEHGRWNREFFTRVQAIYSLSE